jgi:hypothetical protein
MIDMWLISRFAKSTTASLGILNTHVNEISLIYDCYSSIRDISFISENGVSKTYEFSCSVLSSYTIVLCLFTTNNMPVFIF